MKGVIFVLTLVLAFCLVFPISFAVDAVLINLNGSCDSSGNAEVSMLHKGGAIKVSDINIKSILWLTNSSKELKGEWTLNSQPNPIYLSEDYSKAVFRTKDSPFKKKGIYEIHFSFMQKKEDLLPTDVSIAVSCPGIPCSSNIDCDFDSACLNSTCMPLICKPSEFIEFNRCVPRCNDNNPCTIDIYKNGECYYERNLSSCCTTDADCNLGKACSIDKCVDNRCVHYPVVCNASIDKCINAYCVEPKGCVYETAESCLAKENEKREYLVVVEKPKVYRQKFLSGFLKAVMDFFRSLF